MRSRGRSASMLRSLSKPISTSATSRSLLETSTLQTSAEPLTTHPHRDISFRPWDRRQEKTIVTNTSLNSEEEKPITPTVSNDSVVIPASNLKPGSYTLHKRFIGLINQVVLLSVAPPACTALWLFFTEQMLLSVLNIIAILMKNPKDRRPDDYIVLATAAHNISDYQTGASVGAARHKFAKTLIHCQTSKEVMEVLIDNRILNEGGMSFINEWLKHHQGPIGVRVGRTGSVIVYPYSVRSVSFGGPCTIRLFPQYKANKSTQLSLPEPETKKRNFVKIDL